MSENRRQILEMLSKGQITADEAEGLIGALEKEPPATGAANDSEPAPKAKPKFIRVVVDDNGGGTKVNIRVPMQLLRAGVRLASLIPDQARARVNVALSKEGIPFDVSQIKPENLEELIDHLDEFTVDVDDKNAKVKVFCE